MRFAIALGALAVLTPSCGRDSRQASGSSASVGAPSATASLADLAAPSSAPPSSAVPASTATAAPTTAGGAPSASSSPGEEPKTVSIVSYSSQGEHPALISRCVEFALHYSTPRPPALAGSVGGVVSSATCAVAVKWGPLAICAGMKLPITVGKPPVPIPPATTYYFHISAAVDAAVERSCREAGGAWTLTDEGRKSR